MASEVDIRTFTRRRLSDEPDLSKLTLGILRRQYLAYIGHESLSPEARNLMKRVVKEELMKMQDRDHGVNKSENTLKRKRKEKDISEITVDESKTKKIHHQSSSSENTDTDMEKGGNDETEIKVEKDLKTESEESEDDEQPNQTGDVKQRTIKSNYQTHRVDEDSTGEETDESTEYKQGKKFGKSNSDDGGQTQKVQRRPNTMENGKKRSRNTSDGKKPSTTQGDEDETNGKREKTHKRDSCATAEGDGEKEKKLSTESRKGELAEDSDSSSLPSLDDEKDSERAKTQEGKKATGKKVIVSKKVSRRENEDDKAIVRLKRYIALCGVRRNYKQLLDGSRSIRAKVAVLRKELESLGVQGQPSIAKCKKARLRREEAEELAALDISNIITTQGRPKRRGATAWHVPPSSSYKRMLNSSSDSDENNQTGRGCKRATNWDNLQGIISDDGDSS